MRSNAWHALHYNKIAKMIRDRRQIPPTSEDSFEYASDIGKQELLNELTLEFAEYFEKLNPNFDPNKFIIACGYTVEEENGS